jgi:manganese/zinc/iron transport system ATP- binding protein
MPRIQASPLLFMKVTKTHTSVDHRLMSLETYQVSVNYDRTPVLWDISLAIPTGLLVGIIGPNGAGKSTLIKTALGLVKPIAGKIEFFGQNLKKVRLQIAYVPQRESVDWDFPVTVRDVVLMGRYGRLGLFRRPREADWIAADHYLRLVGMGEYAQRQINQLSGGQQQRVFLARALLQEADVYFMDEPLKGIDLATEIVIIQLLRQLRDQGKTIFIVHHDLNTVENYFDWVILLNMHLIAYGKTEETFTPQNLQSTYGKSYGLFDEALKLSQQRQMGTKTEG